MTFKLVRHEIKLDGPVGKQSSPANDAGAQLGDGIVSIQRHAARLPRKLLLLAGAAVAFAGGMQPAGAFEYDIGDYQISLDTTLSSSVGVRTSPIDERFVGYVNGGKFPIGNADNGDLNFKQGGIVEATQRATTELQIKHDDYGIFVRATGFFDPIYTDNVDNFRFPLPRATVRDIGTDFRLLDAYFFSRPEIFGHEVDVRVGNQALNWGESTFIQFGINSITPLDVTALRVPGSELRTAFLPIPVLDLKTEVAPQFTVEGFWQPYWTRTKLEPDGSFFGNNDAVTDGGTFNNLDSLYPDNPNCVYAASLAQSNLFGACVPRSADRHPTGVGEGGIALRTTVPSLNDAEFGLYFENYDSRTPFVDFRTGNAHINTNALSSLIKYLALAPNPLLPFIGGTQTYFQNTYTATTSYFDDYPSNIKLIGFSYNFSAPGGWAIQGEVSHRFDQPVQLAGADLAFANEAPAVCRTAAQGLALTGPICASAKADPVIQATGGIKGFNQEVQGWKPYDVTQWQTTATKLFSAIPAMSINSIALIGEIGFDYMHNFGHLAGLYNAPYTTDTNSAFSPYAVVNGGYVKPGQVTNLLSTKGLATQLSAAYTIATVVDMPNVLPYGIGMKPTLSLQHDFYGTSPVGVNVFVGNTAAASVGVSFSYLQAWSLGVQYTNHFPVFSAGKFYGLIDRDFVSATLSYEF